jgi:hypothetical protein
MTPRQAYCGGVARRCASILTECACLLFRDYGAAAYQRFVLANPAGRVRGVERQIVRGWGRT